MSNPEAPVAAEGDAVVTADKPHMVRGGPADMPAYLRKAIADSVQADLADPGKSAANAWLVDRNRPPVPA